MPIYDFECECCGNVAEHIARIEEEILACESCGAQAHRIISLTGVHCANQDAEWIRSIVEVVDKESNEPHIAEFRKNPNRTTLRNFMQKQGIRHLEPGEGPTKPDPPNMEKINREVWDKHQKRMRLEI